jgi:imidazolonepropionase-like amidohydrolase
MADKIALTRVRVFDGRRLLEPGTIVFEDGVIGGDPHGARVIDGHGGVLLPGLIDAHVHLHGPQWCLTAPLMAWSATRDRRGRS